MKSWWLRGLFFGLAAILVGEALSLFMTNRLRNGVLRASTCREKSEAYRHLFQRVGKDGLVELLADRDIGIALQAAWELNKKATELDHPVGHGPNGKYDPARLARFVAFLKQRTRAPVPDWWATEITQVDFRSKSYLSAAMTFRNGDHRKRLQSPSGILFPIDVELEVVENEVRYQKSGRIAEFPMTIFDSLKHTSITGAFDDKGIIVAVFDGSWGDPFDLTRFEKRSETADWTATVWAVRQEDGIRMGYNVHRVELVEKDGRIFVFGAESNGMYLEAFDTETGRNLYRFCNSYWSNFSEAWTDYE